MIRNYSYLAIAHLR